MQKMTDRGTAQNRNIYSSLRKRILFLELEPGTKLSENTLCGEYGIGRPGIREILSRLSIEGCVEVFPQSGTFVRRIVMDNVYQIAKSRIAVGQRLIRETCAKGLSREQDNALVSMSGSVSGSRSAEEYLQRYEAFCRLIEAFCGRSHTWDFLSSVSCDFERAQYLCFKTYGSGPSLSYSILEQGNVETRMLTESLLRHDADAACLILESHYNQILIQASMLVNYYPAYFKEDRAAS